LQKRIVSIALISLVLLSLLVPISVPFVQAKNDKDENLIPVIIDTVGPPKKEHDDDVKELGGKVKYKYKLIDAMAVSLPEKVIDKLMKKGWVKSISPDVEVQALLDVSVPTIKAPDVWGKGYDGSGIKIAICDTGIDANHPDLRGKVVAQAKFLSSIWGLFEGTEDNNGHGTHCAGIAAGRGAVYRGVAPGASLINAKCLDMYGSGYLSDVIAAIDWSVNVGANVISLSIGAAGPCSGTCALCRACDSAVDRGVVVVVAAGNSGPDSQTITCPGNAKKVITVGATDDHVTTSTADDTITDWSSRGPTVDNRAKPDVVAPGVNIMSCKFNTGSYIEMSGTSMATPHVSGATALLLQAKVAPADVKNVLMNTAIKLTNPNTGGPYYINTQGAGEIDILAALQSVLPAHDVAVTAIDAPSWIVQGDTVTVEVTLENQATYGETFDVVLTDKTDDTNVVQIGSQSVELKAGASTPVTFYWVTTDAALTDHTLIASAGPVDGETDTADNVKSTVITVRVPSRDIAVTTITATPSTVYQGKSVLVDVMVANEGTSGETFDVVLTDKIEGTDGAQIDPITVTALEAGASTTVSFSWDTTGAALIDHTLIASAGPVEYEIDTDDNAESTVVTVIKPSHDVAVTSITATPSTAYKGDIVSVSVVIANEGAFDETFDVVLTDKTDGVQIGSQSVTTLEAGSSTATFTWVTSSSSLGRHALGATAGPVADETDIADNSEETTVTIDDTPTADVSIAMSKKSFMKIMWRVTATVTLKLNGNPIIGVIVNGHWSGALARAVYGITDSNGKVSLMTDWLLGTGTIYFTIDSVMKDSQVYNLRGDKTKSIAGP